MWLRRKRNGEEPLRNATTNSIAPTGSIALIAGCSCSIEPLFGIAFRRKNILRGETLAYVEPMLINQLKKLKQDTPEILEEVMLKGSIAPIRKIPQEIRSLFKTAHEIAPARHLEQQLAFQEFTDNAVSKTINLPFSATADDVDAILKGAWRGGAKGITVYRDRSKQAQVIYQGIEEDSTQRCKICTV